MLKYGYVNGFLWGANEDTSVLVDSINLLFGVSAVYQNRIVLNNIGKLSNINAMLTYVEC